MEEWRQTLGEDSDLMFLGNSTSVVCNKTRQDCKKLKQWDQS